MNLESNLTQLLYVVLYTLFPVLDIFQKVFWLVLSEKNFHYVAGEDGYKTEDSGCKIQEIKDMTTLCLCHTFYKSIIAFHFKIQN